MIENNDYELVSLAQDGNEDAINLIYKNYTPIIINKSKNAILSVPHHGIDIDDIKQEAYIGLDEAIKNFSQDNDASFYTFAMLCIERQISNFIRKTTNSRAKLLNEAVVIDQDMERLISNNVDIELTVLGREYNASFINSTREKLTIFERKVLDLILQEYTLDEIASKLHREKKAIYNAIQRIKLKFKNNKNDN